MKLPQMPLQQRPMLPTPTPTQAQAPGMFGRMNQFRNNNRDALLQLGIGLMSGQNAQQQMAMGAQGFGSARLATNEKREQQEKLNKTLEFLKQKNPELAAAVEAGAIDAGAAYSHHLKAQTSGDASNTRFSTQPQLFEREDGTTAFGTFGSDGSFKEIETPGGLSPASPVDKIDLGNEWLLLDKRTGQEVGRQPKDSFTPAYDSGRGGELGKADAAAQTEAPKNITNALTTASQLDELIIHPGLEQIYGSMDQYRPSALMGTQGKDALARYKQLQGKAFLEAYGMLKGGGQITEVEGIKAEAAMARLDRAQDVETAREALKEFRDAVRDGARKLQTQYGTQPASNSDWVDKGNGVRVRQVGQ